MIGLLQRVLRAEVHIGDQPTASIGPGLLVLVGVRPTDDESSANRLVTRLLQYRAFKESAQWFSSRFDTESTRHFRSVRLEEKYRRQTPELVWTLTVEDFAALAALAFAPRELPTVGLDHLHAPLVSIREQAAHVVALLRRGEPMTFRQLIAGANLKGVIIARFLAVLELYRQGSVGYDQLEPLGELTLHWTAEHWTDDSLANLGGDYDA